MINNIKINAPLPKYKYSKNGRTYYGKQNHKCKRCKRQFVASKAEKKLELKETVKKLLLERISQRYLFNTAQYGFLENME